MAFQSVPQTAEIVIQYLSNTINSANVLQAKKLGGYDLADLALLAATVDAEVAAEWLPLQTQDVTYIQTLVRGLEFINDQEAVDDTSSAIGGVATKGLPGNVTFSIKKSSGLTGRSARGRIYWIGLTSDNLAANENLLDVSAAAAIEDAVEALRAAIAATVWDPVIVSRFFAGAQRETGAVFPWIATNTVNNNVDSQRRRLQP